MVTPYPLLLFGGEIVVKHELMTICIDDWIEFRSPGKVAVLIKQLRAVSITSEFAGVHDNHTAKVRST